MRTPEIVALFVGLAVALSPVSRSEASDSDSQQLPASPKLKQHNLDGRTIPTISDDSGQVGSSTSKAPIERRDTLDERYEPIPASTASTKTTSKTSREGYFFRGDGQPPEKMFKSGFQSKGTNLNLEEHFSPGFGKASGYISVTRSREAAKGFAKTNVNGETDMSYVYVITPDSVPDGYWMPEVPWKIKLASTSKDKLAEEMEFAVPRAIPPESVAGVYEKAASGGKWKWRANPDAATKLKSGVKTNLWCSSRKREVCDLAPDVEDGTAPPEKDAASPEGDDKKPAGTGEEEPAVPRPGTEEPGEPELALSAETASESEFAALMRIHKLTPVAEERWKMSLRDVRSKLLGYQRLEPKSPMLRPGTLGKWKAPAIGGGVALAGILWLGGVVQAFAANTTALDRFAAVTAIVPLVGCSTQLVAGAARGQIDGVDSALCYLGDALILGGVTAPIGIVVHMVRAIIQIVEPPPKLPTQDEMKTKRDEAWDKFLRQNLYKYLYSDKYYYETGDGFATKLESSLAIEAAAVISHGAQTMGAINATSVRAIAQAGSSKEQDEIQRGAEASKQAVQELIRANITSRHRNYLIGVPATLRDNAVESLTLAADKYNSDFINDLQSMPMLQRYASGPGIEDIAGALSGGPFASDPLSDARERMYEIANYLRGQPIRIPSRFDIAYIVGQSKGLIDLVDAPVLSPQAYLKEARPEWDDKTIETTCIQQAQRMTLLLQGKRDGADLDKPNPDPVMDGLSVMTAIKLGRLYDEWKVAYAHREFSLYLPENMIPFVALPSLTFSADEKDPSNAQYIAIALDIDKAKVEAALDVKAS